MKTADEIAADIISVLPDIAPPDELVDRLKNVLSFKEDRVQFKTNVLILAALHVEDLTKGHPTVDKEAAMRVAANDLIDAAAFLVRAFKRRAGDELQCARFAMVAYGIAESVLVREWNGAEAEILREGISVRAELEKPHGDDLAALDHAVTR